MYGQLALGPMVRMSGVFNGTWKGSILVVGKESVPAITLSHGDDVRVLNAQMLDTIGKKTFWRYNVELPQAKKLQYWQFQIQGRRGSIPVAGTKNKARFVFGSCMGFHDEAISIKMGGVGILPAEILRRHEKKPYHVLLLGGDQIYCDGVLESLPEMQKWLAIKDEVVRAASPFTDELRAEVTKYYLQHYLAHFNNPDLAKTFANLPFHATWDDHDIFDGWGSYDRFHKTVVAQEVFKIAKRMYLLVQQHTTEEHCRADGFIGVNGQSSILRLSKDTTALFIDSRSTRSKEKMLEPDEWEAIFEALETVEAKFLFVVFSVPLIYPEFGLLENILDKLNKHEVTRNWFIQRLFGKHVLNKYTREYELLDDMVDHPKSAYHIDERNQFFRKLFALAARKNIRICFGGGDVHAMGYGEIRSSADIARELDPGYAPQFISSALANEPQPELVVKILRSIGKLMGDEECMVRFGDDNKSLYACRGFMTFAVGSALRARWYLEKENENELIRAHVKIPALKTQFSTQTLARG